MVDITGEAYSYGGNNPISNSDPTGLCWGPQFICSFGSGVKDGTVGMVKSLVGPSPEQRLLMYLQIAREDGVEAAAAAPLHDVKNEVVGMFANAEKSNPLYWYERVKADGWNDTINSAAYFAGTLTPQVALAIATERLVGGGPAKLPAEGEGLLRPGPWAAESVPSSSPFKILSSERKLLNPIGDAHGCHSCGAPTPGTKSGNWVGDHQPATSLNGAGAPQRLYPQCITCSNKQGLYIMNMPKPRDFWG
jgi:hypothetical protein